MRFGHLTTVAGHQHFAAGSWQLLYCPQLCESAAVLPPASSSAAALPLCRLFRLSSPHRQLYLCSPPARPVGDAVDRSPDLSMTTTRGQSPGLAPFITSKNWVTGSHASLEVIQ